MSVRRRGLSTALPLLWLLQLLLFIVCDAAQFVAPPARLHLYRPHGFEVSIPALPNVTLFAFHGQLNAEFEAHEGGHWSRDVTAAVNGRFRFRDCAAELRSTDVLHFWTFVVYNGLGYHQEAGRFELRSEATSATGFGTTAECLDERSVAPVAAASSSSAIEYRAPAVEVRLLSPRGFEASIAGWYITIIRLNLEFIALWGFPFT